MLDRRVAVLSIFHVLVNIIYHSRLIRSEWQGLVSAGFIKLVTMTVLGVNYKIRRKSLGINSIYWMLHACMGVSVCACVHVWVYVPNASSLLDANELWCAHMDIYIYIYIYIYIQRLELSSLSSYALLISVNRIRQVNPEISDKMILYSRCDRLLTNQAWLGVK